MIEKIGECNQKWTLLIYIRVITNMISIVLVGGVVDRDRDSANWSRSVAQR